MGPFLVFWGHPTTMTETCIALPCYSIGDKGTKVSLCSNRQLVRCHFCFIFLSTSLSSFGVLKFTKVLSSGSNWLRVSVETYRTC